VVGGVWELSGLFSSSSSSSSLIRFEPASVTPNTRVRTSSWQQQWKHLFLCPVNVFYEYVWSFRVDFWFEGLSSSPGPIREEDVDGRSASMLDPASWLAACCWVGWTKAVACVLVGWVMEVDVFTRAELVECTEAPALVWASEINTFPSETSHVGFHHSIISEWALIRDYF